MTKQELIKWFDNYFNNCYYVTHSDYPESIFMFYDLKYVRKLKLDKIKGENIDSNNIVGECLFEQDWKNNFFYCNYNKIWKYIMYNSTYDYSDIQKFIKDRLEEHSKMNIMTPEYRLYRFARLQVTLEEHSKMNIMTPLQLPLREGSALEEHSKMNIMTPYAELWQPTSLLEEHSKMNIMTPIMWEGIPIQQLEEHSKMNIMTPQSHLYWHWPTLEEHSKMNIMTPISDSQRGLIGLEEHSKMNIMTPESDLSATFEKLEHSKMNIMTPIAHTTVIQK